MLSKEGCIVKTCVIFCAGTLEGTVLPIHPEDYVIAADGGYAHTQMLGITPDGVLGDFDSLGYTPEGAKVFPAEKDDTDTMLAVRRGLEEGCARFLIYGGLSGPRLDHTVANLQTLQFLADRGARGYLMGSGQLATVIKNETMEFPAGWQGYLSLFCMGRDARGVTLRGLKYSLEKGDLQAGFPLGVSNQFTGEAASVCVEDGSLLVIYDAKNGIAE